MQVESIFYHEGTKNTKSLQSEPDILLTDITNLFLSNDIFVIKSESFTVIP